MLMECVKFGTVISVATPEAPGYFGCVVITFKTSDGANACAEAMHGRWGFVLRLYLFNIPVLDFFKT